MTTYTSEMNLIRARFNALSILRQTVLDWAAWREFAQLTGVASSQLALIQAVLRRPGLTLGGYVAHLHSYDSAIIATLLDQLVAQNLLLVTERSKYWPNEAAESFNRRLAETTNTALAAWATLPAADLATLAAWSERMCAAIPPENLGNHGLYGFGVRPVAGATAAERAWVAALALLHYRADAYHLAWSATGISASWGVMVWLCSDHQASHSAESLRSHATPYLGATAAPTLTTLLANGWLLADATGIRLTATGWAQVNEIEQFVAADCAPIIAALDHSEHRRFGRFAAHLRSCVAAYHRSRRK